MRKLLLVIAATGLLLISYTIGCLVKEWLGWT